MAKHQTQMLLTATASWFEEKEDEKWCVFTISLM